MSISIVPIMTSNSMDGYKVTASSTYSTGYHPYYAFDADETGSYWCSVTNDTSTAWIKIELPNNEICDTVEIYAPSYYPLSFKILGSKDDSIYDELLYVTDSSNLKDSKQQYKLTKTGFYKFYKLQYIRSTNSSWAGITNLKYIKTHGERILNSTIEIVDSSRIILEYDSEVYGIYNNQIIIDGKYKHKIYKNNISDDNLIYSTEIKVNEKLNRKLSFDTE